MFRKETGDWQLGPTFGEHVFEETMDRGGVTPLTQCNHSTKQL